MVNCTICEENITEGVHCKDCRLLLDTMNGAYLVELYRDDVIALDKFREIRTKMIKKTQEDKDIRKQEFLDKWNKVVIT